MAFSPVLSIIPVSKNKASMQDHLSFNLKPQYSIINLFSFGLKSVFCV